MMNIQLQLCGLSILFVLLYFYRGQKKLYLRTEVAFSKCFAGIFISLILDILSIVAIFHVDVLPMFFVKLICKIYLVSLTIVVYLAFSYVCADVCFDVAKHRKVTFKYRVLTAFFDLLVLFLPIDVYFDAEKRDAHTFGMSAYAAFACASILLISIFCYLIKGKKVINQTRRKAMWLWMILWTIAAVIQMSFDGAVLLIGYVSVLGIMIVYLMLENPMENIDRVTGLYNQNAMLHYVTQLYREKQSFCVLTVIFEQVSGGRFESAPESRLGAEMIEFLLHIPKADVFKNVDNEIVLIFKEEAEAEHAIAQITERFTEGFCKDSFDGADAIRENRLIPNCYYILIPNAAIVETVEDLSYLLRYTKENNTDMANQQVLRVSEAMISRMMQERETERMIFAAMENDRVEVFYQPIYSTKEKGFTSAEALVRIRDEKGELIPPGKFIPIAERNGMILRLGEIVFDKVCDFIKRTNPEQYGIRYIEVNLSVVQCAYENLAKTYMEIMERHDVNPKFINLEITESASLNAKKILLKNMKTLMDYGVTFSLDDFGTGQSNLNYIVDMPVAIVKFDKSMTSAYFENQKAQYVMDAAMHMIHGMKLEIVSEGIETEQQFETMEQLNIGYIQGYYFSKPLPEADYLEFVRKSRFETR